MTGTNAVYSTTLVINSSMFRLQNPNNFQFPPYIQDIDISPSSSASASLLIESKSKPKLVCNNVFLFMPQLFAHNGHGSQLNSYLLASLVARFKNHAMVFLEPPNMLNVFKSNLQWGCPPRHGTWR